MKVGTCMTCKHFIGEGKCAAFPDQIPDSIIEGYFDHKKKMPGQKNDIVYEPIVITKQQKKNNNDEQTLRD